jgi:hypothetical protein
MTATDAACDAAAAAAVAANANPNANRGLTMALLSVAQAEKATIIAAPPTWSTWTRSIILDG